VKDYTLVAFALRAQNVLYQRESDRLGTVAGDLETGLFPPSRLWTAPSPTRRLLILSATEPLPPCRPASGWVGTGLASFLRSW